MKTNKFLIILAILISALVGYGFFAANNGEQFRLLLTIGSGLCFAVTLSGCLGISIEGKTGNIHFKLISTLFLIVFFICNLFFGFLGMKVAPYIITN